ncbi:hypothetical protein B2G71_22810 [Novosphingobium sp. PC22D]|uniref:hypothetical protein n=1 Tax=Novosphingobium sp. PC22D TaxID=1962403 RepID=UPI000BF244A2|nr:hypothetical protein [Novosphingobium sp. PC22D]PEQ10341.1 hypothetical protein B2G71_22810 [Novosphingobium sp. PC22D]
MSLHLVTPLDRIADEAPDEPLLDMRAWRRRSADLAYILLKAAGFLASAYMVTLGFPLLVFLVASGGNLEIMFGQIASLAGHYGAASAGARADFAQGVVLGLFGISSLVMIWRLPRFLAELETGLAWGHEA